MDHGVKFTFLCHTAHTDNNCKFPTVKDFGHETQKITCVKSYMDMDTLIHPMLLGYMPRKFPQSFE